MADAVNADEVFVELFEPGGYPTGFPVITDAPSMQKPLSFPTGKSQWFDSATRVLVMVSAFGESDSTRRSFALKNLISVQPAVLFQNCTNVINCSVTVCYAVQIYELSYIHL